MNDALLARLRDSEDNFVERKPDGVGRHDIRRTLVAFANSVPEGREGTLFLGVRDEGEIAGVREPDKLQQTIRSVCQEDCYPPIAFQTEVLLVENKAVLAVKIPSSRDRPHFAGQAYVREGSQTIAASKKVFETLVASRLDKCWEILKHQDRPLTVVALGRELGSISGFYDKSYKTGHECRVIECNAQFVRLQDLATDRYVSVPLEHVTVLWDEAKHRPLLVINPTRGNF